MFEYEIQQDDTGLQITDHYSGQRTRYWFNYHQYSITAEQLGTYLATLFDHITYVREAGEKLGVSRSQLNYHDRSKFDLEELPYYVRNFQGDKADPDGFAKAWLHHIHWNEHHWQHWMFPDGFTPKGSKVENGIVFMPEEYVTEMVADWMGASKAYTGSFNMEEWLTGNLPKIKLHSESWAILGRVLSDMPGGYRGLIVDMQANGVI